jgi:hypothetical protein
MQYTAIYKNRACTKKAATAVKVSKLQEIAAINADAQILYETHKEQRKADRLAARQKKRELKSA